MNRVCIRQSDIDGIGLIDASYNGFAFRRHYHLEYHIGLIVGGSQRYHCRGASHHVGPGQLVMMAPDQLHDGQAGDGHGYRTKVFTLGSPWLQRSLRDLTGEQELCFDQHQVADPALYRSLVGAHAMLASSQHARLARDCLPLELLEQLVCRHGRMQPRRVSKLGRRDLDEIRDYLMANLDQPVRLADLTRLCGLSESGLTRAFKAATGMTPYAWLARLRLEQAMSMLRSGVPVTDVAQAVGFFDQAHFSRAFKQQFGIAPGRIASGDRGRTGHGGH